jgi:hypothetical protein
MLAGLTGGMHMRLFILAMALTLMAGGLAFGADVDGKWTGTVQTPGGEMPITFMFKAEGATLTGAMLGQENKQIPIKDGKIDGNNISFSIPIDMGGETIQLAYKGVVSPDQIKLTGESMGQPFELIVKKAK